MREAIAQSAGSAPLGGSIRGRLFTADHPDSLARGAQVTLVTGPPSGERTEQTVTAGSDGSYRFDGLSTDPAVSYLLRVDYRGNAFLGAPTGFTTGQSELERSFLVSAQAPPIDRMLAGEAGLPPDHPPVPPATGNPVTIQPGPTLLITLVVVALFALPWIAARRRDRAVSAPPADAEIALLIRDIAALDDRHDAGQLSTEDWQRVRSSLLVQLRARTAPRVTAEGAPGAAADTSPRAGAAH